MGVLSFNPVSRSFNAIVQVMQKVHAPDYIVRPNAEVHPEHMFMQKQRMGAVVVDDTIEDNNVFDSDGIFYDFEAWKASAVIRIYDLRGTVHPVDVWKQMQADMLAQYNFDEDFKTWQHILWALLVERIHFYLKYNCYPEPLNAWVRQQLNGVPEFPDME